jgi:Leucine-rich repeat (LRR) protein
MMTKLVKYPDVICNLKSLKDLTLSSISIKTLLPAALSNLTNLESLFIHLNLKQLPESIGNLNALKWIHIGSSNLTTLPESLDDLFWRKAHETEESKKMELICFYGCADLVFSPKMEETVELLEEHCQVYLQDADETPWE